MPSQGTQLRNASVPLKRIGMVLSCWQMAILVFIGFIALPVLKFNTYRCLFAGVYSPIWTPFHSTPKVGKGKEFLKHPLILCRWTDWTVSFSLAAQSLASCSSLSSEKASNGQPPSIFQLAFFKDRRKPGSPRCWKDSCLSHSRASYCHSLPRGLFFKNSFPKSKAVTTSQGSSL